VTTFIAFEQIALEYSDKIEPERVCLPAAGQLFFHLRQMVPDPQFLEYFGAEKGSRQRDFSGSNLPPARCRTVAACTKKTTDLDALERLHNGVDRAPWRERSKKGPFTSVSLEEFTKDSLGTRSKRAVRPSTWRIDPCFGVKGGAGATPVSVGCAATNPPSVAPLCRGSFPPLPFQEPVHFVMRIALPIDH
jgi:hypothetical protein